MGLMQGGFKNLSIKIVRKTQLQSQLPNVSINMYTGYQRHHRPQARRSFFERHGLVVQSRAGLVLLECVPGRGQIIEENKEVNNPLDNSAGYAWWKKTKNT